MNKKSPTLDDIRQKIDVTDQALLELLSKRSYLVQQIATAKNNSDNTEILRPTREIQQIQYFLKWYHEHQSIMPLQGFYGIWREIISTAINQQNQLNLVYTDHNAILAHNHFGQATHYIHVSTPQKALNKVQKSQNTIAVLPITKGDWWCHIPHGLKVFATLPVLAGKIEQFCVGKITLKPSHNDISIIYGTQNIIPQEAKLLATHGEYHLAYLDGFISKKDLPHHLYLIGASNMIIKDNIS